MYVCICRGITDSQIKQAVSSGDASSMRCLNKGLGVAMQCGKCGKFAKQILRQTLATSKPQETQSI